MRCQESEVYVHAYLDGELDFINAAKFEAHMKECADCARAYRNLQSLRSGFASRALYFQAPAHLRNRIRLERLADAETKGLRKVEDSVRSRKNQWFWKNPWEVVGLAACAALIAMIVFTWLRPSTSRRSQQQLLAQEVLDSHIRSLMGSHLVDVPSSDQHTVKPWFDGKVDFSPPVPDFSQEGFPLVGGRLDYLGSRPVAALVYRRRKHIINLFIWPADQASGEGSLTRQGYHLAHWSQNHMRYWAVSDVNPAELNKFIQLVRKSQSATP